jgi:divalent metal cation (Fe/Co/Zn/Cd) transporter
VSGSQRPGGGHDHGHGPRGAGHRRPLAVVLGISAATRAVVLLAVGGFVLAEAIRRLVEPSPVASGVMVIFGVAGLAVRAHVEHSTVQFEPASHAAHEHPAHA